MNKLIDIRAANFVAQLSQCNGRLIAAYWAQFKGVDTKGDGFAPAEIEFAVFASYATAWAGVVIYANHTIAHAIYQSAFGANNFSRLILIKLFRVSRHEGSV